MKIFILIIKYIRKKNYLRNIKYENIIFDEMINNCKKYILDIK